jgi:Heterokaryon incompatibility protein (HET)
VALSYCWGGETSFKLTLKNLSQWITTGFEVKSFPQTLKDAIMVTQRLGISYLWIDAVCIIQDDENDKMHEIAKMAEIYRGAELTISAAKAERVSKGFLSRPEKLPYYHAFNVESQGDVNGKILISQGTPRDAKDPVDYQGWTLQERCLSPRLLEYRSQSTHWVCLQEANVDGGSGSLPLGHCHVLYDRSRLGVTKAQGMDANGLQKAIQNWNAIVHEYTGRQLSEPNDKLVAISAVASVYSSLFGDYLAGIWKIDLSNQLLWYITNPTESRRAIKRAPTWSWAIVERYTFQLRKTRTRFIRLRLAKLLLNLNRNICPLAK